jgi:hypothetical protein
MARTTFSVRVNLMALLLLPRPNKSYLWLSVIKVIDIPPVFLSNPNFNDISRKPLIAI